MRLEPYGKTTIRGRHYDGDGDTVEVSMRYGDCEGEIDAANREAWGTHDKHGFSAFIFQRPFIVTIMRRLNGEVEV